MPETVDADIFLVEDNPNDAELLMRVLKKRNVSNKIVHVKDGAEALDYIFRSGPYEGQKGNYPKVIFLDLKLPKVDGLEVLKKIRADDRTKMIPVVMLTSSKEEKDVVESYRLGVNSYVVKPVDFEKFADAISEVGFYWLLLNQYPSMY